MSRILVAAWWVLMLLSAPARGHDSANWIMADPDTRWCCGPQDCFELRAVQPTNVGWAFRHPVTGDPVLVPYTFKARYPSVNEHFWACFMPGGAVRCFFTSPEGV